ncbi:hypothetical protein [Desulforamulus profundi]|uniref:hypothetical protein n=1 Tax=Desulforamulus profundi TaxID=1383067 RepID=UPI0011786723|nr:hypothetical protein [Desulforamulus profundi]
MDFDKEKLLKIVNKLNDKDSYLFKLRSGLIDNKVHTLTEISLLLNISQDELCEELRRIERFVLSEYHKNP